MMDHSNSTALGQRPPRTKSMTALKPPKRTADLSARLVSGLASPSLLQFEYAPPPETQAASIGSLMRFAGAFMLPVLLCALVAGAASLWLAPRYAARTDMMIHMQQSGDAVLRYFSSQNLVIKNPSVLEPVSRETQLSYETLMRDLSVDFPKGGNVMRIQFIDKDPELALSVVRKVLAEYEKLVVPIELDESVGHQIIAAPYVDASPAFPKPGQFAAIGAALGLIFSMACVALGRQLRSASWRP